MTEDYLTLRGVAIRGDHIRQTDHLKRGVALPSNGSVDLRTVRDQLVGKVALGLNESDDVLVEAAVPVRELDRLTDSPYLCVAIRIEEDEEDDANEVAFVAVCASTSDPRQLPYRLTNVPENELVRGLLSRMGYRPLRIVDERHEAEFTYDGETGWSVTFDEDKSHVEWQHVTECDQEATLAGIARGLGYESWTQLEELGEDDVELGQRLFAELSHLLSRHVI